MTGYSELEDWHRIDWTDKRTLERFHQISEKAQRIYSQMKRYFLEREDAITCLLVGAFSRQNTILIGDVGTAKSALVSAFARRIRMEGNWFFDILLSPHTPIESLMGAINIERMVNESRYERNVAGMLPSAVIASLDEVFKADSALHNELLMILNEHEYVNDGKRMKCPLLTAVLASNELPSDEEEVTSHALFDRILLRCKVESLCSEDNLLRLMDYSVFSDKDYFEHGDYVTLSVDEWREAINMVFNISVPDHVKERANTIRRKLMLLGMPPSDRRLREAMSAVRANAFLHGRNVADIRDLDILRFVFWREVEQIPTVTNIVLEASNPRKAKVIKYRENMHEILEEVRKHAEADNIALLERELFRYVGKLKRCLDESRAICLEEDDCYRGELESILAEMESIPSEVTNIVYGKRMDISGGQ